MVRCIAEAARMVLVAALAAPAAIPAQSPAPLSPQPVSLSLRNNLSPEVRGDLAMAHQQYAAAIEDYNEAPKDSAIIWNKLGIAYHHLFAFNEAKRDYQMALRLRPNYPEALNNLGAVYYGKKDYRRAEKYYHRAIRLEPRSAAIYSNLGIAYFAQRKVNKGIAAFRSAFVLDPGVFDTNPQLVTESLSTHERAEQDFCLARLFAQSGHDQQAIDFLRKALDEGFDDRKELLQDQTLASLRGTPEFTQLMTEQTVQKLR